MCLDGKLLQPVVERLGEVLRNELGGFRKLDEKLLIRFLLGFLVHLKNRGGIVQLVLRQYVASFGSTYLLNQKNWLPNFGPVSRAPVFLTAKKGSRFDQLFSSSSSRFTWYENWYEKNFRLLTPQLDVDMCRDFYHLVLKTLVAEGVLEQELVKNDQVWGIKPEALVVSSRVRQLRCEHCGHNLSVAAEESAFFEQAPCPRFHCTGRYQPLETGVDYYGKLYATGDVARIFAREHTGLLTRKEREDLEAEFKAEGDNRQVVEAFKVDADFPFGFDFLAKVDFCEINFGEKSEIGEQVAIAGEETPRQGFALCRVCGKVQGRNDKEPVHAFTCTARDKDNDKNLIDCFYLYRQFVSEAIRILLPVSIIAGSDRKLQSFIAAMQLGLKRKFRGKIDHLQTTVYEEPLADSSFKRKYLVLYDTVPGGTGYLKQLMRSEQLMEILELSLTALKSCPCNQEEGKDGCYRCLFAVACRCQSFCRSGSS